jgi:hypothetical protein
MWKPVLKRIASDSWAELTGKNITEYSESDIVGETLTDALSYIYTKYKMRIFKVDANEGIISVEDGKELPKPKPKAYSLYDD